MAERYTRIYTLPEQHLEDAPVQILAGALQKDNRNGQIFAQLKLSCTNSHPLKAVHLQIQPLDSYSQPLRTVSHNISVPAATGTAFGQQELIPMPSGAQSFTVSFTTEQVPYAAPAPQSAVPAAQPLAFIPTPISKLQRFLPLIIVAAIMLLDPLVYAYQMHLFGLGDRASSLMSSYFSNVFYTNFILLLTPVFFLLLCYVPQLRTRFFKAICTVFLVILGLQVLMGIINCVLVFSGADYFAFRNFISGFPGAGLLTYGYQLIKTFHIRTLVSFIWEALYFVPGISALLLAKKIKS